MFGMRKRNVIVINGMEFKTNGKGITVTNNSVYVGGELVQEGLSGIVRIEFKGDLASLKTDGSASIHGDIHGDVDVGDSCTCKNVKGNVDAGGSITCGNVGGSIDAGGSVMIER